jgi:hypothetical protein
MSPDAAQGSKSATPLASNERIASLDALVEFGPVIEIVGQRGMNIGQTKCVVGADFIDGFAQMQVQNNDIAHGDAMRGDARPATGDARGSGDVAVVGRSWLMQTYPFVLPVFNLRGLGTLQTGSTTAHSFKQPKCGGGPQTERILAYPTHCPFFPGEAGIAR